MAPFTEVAKMLRGQAFGKTHVPDMDLKGKTCIVTGANTGLGLECAKHLYVLITLLDTQGSV
jgi:retinol dehydrogenase-12